MDKIIQDLINTIMSEDFIPEAVTVNSIAELYTLTLLRTLGMTMIVQDKSVEEIEDASRILIDKINDTITYVQSIAENSGVQEFPEVIG